MSSIPTNFPLTGGKCSAVGRDDAGNFSESSKKFVQDWVDRYIGWDKKHA